MVLPRGGEPGREFSTFSASGRRPAQFPAYEHDDLATTFAPVMLALRQALSMVIDSRAVPIPIVEPTACT